MTRNRTQIEETSSDLKAIRKIEVQRNSSYAYKKRKIFNNDLVNLVLKPMEKT